MLSSLAPLWIFMLLPVWIPLLGVAFGAAKDGLGALRGRTAEPSIHEQIQRRRELAAQPA